MTTKANQKTPAFSHPPIALVVLAVGFPEVPDFTEAQQNTIRQHLRDEFPLMERQERVVVEFNPAARTQSTTTRSMPRFTTRDRTAAVAITPTSLVIETSRYEGFSSYLDLVRGPLDVTATVLKPDAVTSIGHRYIDEIRIPTTGGDAGNREAVDWSIWLDPDLLALGRLPTESGLGAPTAWQAMATYETDVGDATLTLRYGPRDVAAVPADGATRRPAPAPTGPCFLLDWDSRWDPSVPPEFTANEVVDRCTRLYAPVRAMFHHITQRLIPVFDAPKEDQP